MRITESKYKTVNLCIDCLNEFATCNPTVIEFGDGIGNDNVYKCSEYNGPIGCGIEIRDIVPKSG